MSIILYFGCWKGDGHFLYDHTGYRSSRNTEFILPCSIWCLEGLLPPMEKDRVEPEGQVRRILFEGWTMIAFWDRSGDSRMGSKSIFIIEGEFSKQEVIEEAKKQFPELFQRFKVQLV